MPVLSILTFTFGPDIRFSFRAEMLKNTEVDITVNSRWIGGVWNTNYGTPTIGFGFIDFSSSIMTNLLYPPDPDPNCWYTDPVITFDPYNPDDFYIFFVHRCWKGDSLVGEIMLGKNYGPPDDPYSWNFYLILYEGYNFFKDRPEVIHIPTFFGSRILISYMRNGDVSINYSDNGGYSWLLSSYSFSVSRLYTQGSFAWDGYNLYYAFNKVFPAYTEFYISRSTTDGTTWDLPYFITTNGYSSYSCYNFDRPVATFLDLASCSDGKLVIGYLNDFGGRCNVMVSTANTWGGFWSDQVVWPSLNEQIIPSVVCVEPSYLWVVWHERVGYELWNIVARSSPNWGISWNDIDYVSDITIPFDEWTGGYDYNEVVTDNTYLYVSWGNDRREGRSDVYVDISYPLDIKEERFSDGIIEVEENTEIYDAGGRLVFRGKGKTRLPKGVYFVKNGREVSKVIIRR